MIPRHFLAAVAGNMKSSGPGPNPDPVIEWVTLDEITTESGDSNSWGGTTLRNRYPFAALSEEKAFIRLTLKAGGVPTEISKASLGIIAANSGMALVGPPTPVTFDGGALGKTLAAGEVYVTDPIEVPAHSPGDAFAYNALTPTGGYMKMFPPSGGDCGFTLSSDRVYDVSGSSWNTTGQMSNAIRKVEGSDAILPAPVAARYWRLKMKDRRGSSTGDTISMTEINLYDHAGNLVPKAGAVLSASAQWGGSEVAASAYDGNNGTWWAGRTDGTGGEAWITIDHVNPVSVSGFGLVFRNEVATMPRSVQLQYSHDGVEWKDFSGYFNFGMPNTVAGQEYRLGIDRRIWRVAVSAIHTTGFNTGPGFQEIEFRSVAGVAEQPTGGFAAASGQWAVAESADKAFDGNTATDWGTQGVPGWIQYVFSEKKVVEQVKLQARLDTNSAHAPSAFTVQYSDDIGKSWNVVIDKTAEPAWASLEIRTYPVN